MTSTKQMISGAAIGTLFGSLAALLYSQRREIIEKLQEHSEDFNGLKDKAIEYSGSLLNKGKQLNFRKVEYRTSYWQGGLVGLIIGAGAAFLIAPRTRKNLRGHITRVYNDLSERSEEVLHQFKNNSPSLFTHHNGVKKKKPSIRKKTTLK